MKRRRSTAEEDAASEESGNLGPETRDYFAEMYVAGRLADAGWNVYFPRRDKGFDFIITKNVGDHFLMRPVQVKGKYPEKGKKDRATYGYIGRLTELHDEMVLAIAFFAAGERDEPPSHIAYLPRPFLKKTSRGYRSNPAKLRDGQPNPRREYQPLFDREGMIALEGIDWSARQPPPDPRD